MVILYLIIFILAIESIWLYVDRINLIKERDSAEKRAVTHFLKMRDLEKANKEYQEENIILLNNSSECRNKIVDLENNVELLFNNLTPKKKELARPGNQN